MNEASMPTNATVAVFRNHESAETAVKNLLRAGFDMNNLSIIGRDFRTDEAVTGHYSTGDHMRRWGALGAFWGGMWGFLIGSASFFIPSIGSVLVAGPLVSAIVSSLETSVFVGGVSVIGAALVSLGIPRQSVMTYETDLRAGRYLVIAHGSDVEMSRARELLGRSVAESAVQYVA